MPRKNDKSILVDVPVGIKELANMLSNLKRIHRKDLLIEIIDKGIWEYIKDVQNIGTIFAEFNPELADTIDELKNRIARYNNITEMPSKPVEQETNELAEVYVSDN